MLLATLLRHLSRYVLARCRISSRAHYTPQPRPDPALLTTERSSTSNVIDDTLKVNVVSSDFKENPATYTSERYVPEDIDDDLVDPGRKAVKGKRNRRFQEAQAEGIYLWEVTKHYLFRPGVAGGLIGLGMVGLF